MAVPEDPRRCPYRENYTAYYDPVLETWRCPCGWREKR